MSLHTGIEPSQDLVSQFNLPTKKYVDDQDKLRLAKSGGTLTGGLSMDDNKITDLGTPTANTHASTKKYVDDQAALKLDLAGGQMTGPLGLGNGRLWDVGTPTLDTNGANKKYVDDKHALALLKSGGTMTGEINMGDDKITGLKTPTNDTDASTKKYVDDKANAVASAVASLPNASSYYNFLFRSGANNAWIQPATGATGRVFFTGNNDVKITMYAHIFDDDNSVSNLNLYYRIIYWTKAQVKKTSKTFVKTNNNKSVGITGTWLNVFFIDESITLTDIKCFRIEYKYFHTGNLGNESAVHCLVEYI